MKETSLFCSCPDSVSLSWSLWRWQEFSVNPIRSVLLVMQGHTAANANVSKSHLLKSRFKLSLQVLSIQPYLSGVWRPPQSTLKASHENTYTTTGGYRLCPPTTVFPWCSLHLAGFLLIKWILRPLYKTLNKFWQQEVLICHDKVVSQIILLFLLYLVFKIRSHWFEDSFTVMPVVGSLCTEFCIYSKRIFYV